MEQFDNKTVETVGATFLFSFVTDYENPQNHVSPSVFCEQVISVIESGFHENTSLRGSNLSLSVEKNSSHDVLFCALTSVSAIFDYNNLVCCRHTDSSKTCSANSLTFVTSPGSEQASVEHLDSKDLHRKKNWYKEAAKMLVLQNITDILVKCLKHSCRLTAFLSKKALLDGVRNQIIEVSQILRLLEQEFSASLSPSIPIFEALRDLLSQKLFKDSHINKTAFSHVQKFDLQYFIARKVSDINYAFSNSDELLEYLSFLHKLVKCGIFSSENSENLDNSFISGIVETILLPHSKTFLSFSSKSQGHLIASKYLKIIGTLLDIRFVRQMLPVPQGIFAISNQFLIMVMEILYWTRTSGLLICFNFVGSTSRTQYSSLKVKKKVRHISSLLRLICLVTLKACAVVVTKDNFNHKLVVDTLHSFWCQVQLINDATGENSSRDWLPTVFGDQDDHWMAALFCLQNIHKRVKERSQPNDDSMSNPDQSNRKDRSTHSDELMYLICPHRLFLQLSQFVDYDHLVIADFLMSPETSFLPYFTQHLRVITNDWEAFMVACSTMSTNVLANSSPSSKINPEDKSYDLEEKLNSAHTNTKGLDPTHSCGGDSFLNRPQSSKEMKSSYDTLKNFTPQEPSYSFRKRKADVSPVNNSVTFSKTSRYSCEGQGDENLNCTKVSQSHHPDKNRDSLRLVLYSDSDSEDDTDQPNTSTPDKIRPRSFSSELEIETIHFIGRNDDNNQIEKYSEGDAEENTDQDPLNEIDNVMGMLIRLRFHIERLEKRSLFPYNPKPLLRLLEACENVYESQ